MLKLRKEQGFMLVEMMVAMVIGLIIITVIGTILVSSAKGMATVVHYTRAREEMNSALALMKRDLVVGGGTGVLGSATQATLGGQVWTVENGELRQEDSVVVPTEPNQTLKTVGEPPVFSYSGTQSGGENGEGLLRVQLAVNTPYGVVRSDEVLFDGQDGAGPNPNPSPTSSPDPNAKTVGSVSCAEQASVQSFEGVGGRNNWAINVTPGPGRIVAIDWTFSPGQPGQQHDDTPNDNTGVEGSQGEWASNWVEYDQNGPINTQVNYTITDHLGNTFSTSNCSRVVAVHENQPTPAPSPTQAPDPRPLAVQCPQYTVEHSGFNLVDVTWMPQYQGFVTKVEWVMWATAQSGPLPGSQQTYLDEAWTYEHTQRYSLGNESQTTIGKLRITIFKVEGGSQSAQEKECTFGITWSNGTPSIQQQSGW